MRALQKTGKAFCLKSMCLRVAVTQGQRAQDRQWGQKSIFPNHLARRQSSPLPACTPDLQGKAKGGSAWAKTRQKQDSGPWHHACCWFAALLPTSHPGRKEVLPTPTSWWPNRNPTVICVQGAGRGALGSRMPGRMLSKVPQC